MAMANGYTSNEIFQSQAHIWNQTLSFIKSASLKCAIELGIPDIIHKHGQPMTFSQLISNLPINPRKEHCIYRLMRVLVHSGFFTEQQDTGNQQEIAYQLTPVSSLLLKDNPANISAFPLAMLHPALIKPLNFLSTWLKNEDLTAFNTTNGMSYWEYASENPDLNNITYRALADDSVLTSKVLVTECKEVFEGLGSLVDVGGGTGMMAKTILDAFPSMKCIVLDLPHLVASLKGKKNLEYVGGNMLEAIPRADAVLLKWVLHDWTHEECAKILKLCKESIPSKEKGGRVLIVEMVISEQKGDDDSMETKLFFDMLMMFHVTGRERTEKEWAKLFLDAGYAGYKITPALGLRSLIEVYP